MKKRGKLASLHPQDYYGESLISEHHLPYLSIQHDTNIHTSYHNNQQHNTITHTQIHPVAPLPTLRCHICYVHPSFSLCQRLRSSQSRQHWHTVATRAIHSTGTSLQTCIRDPHTHLDRWHHTGHRAKLSKKSTYLLSLSSR